jgi:hypothetical protein
MPKANDLEGQQDQGGKHGGQKGMPKPVPRPPTAKTERQDTPPELDTPKPLPE